MNRFVLSSLALLAAPSPEVRAADHGDAPGVRLDSRLDLNDLYAFQSPADSANVVFIMTVCPLAGTLSPAEFATGSKYEFHIDSTGDAEADFGFRFTFGRRNATTGSVGRLSSSWASLVRSSGAAMAGWDADMRAPQGLR